MAKLNEKDQTVLDNDQQEPTVQERIESVCRVITDEQAAELREYLKQGDVGSEEKLLWNWIQKNYSVTIRCNDPESLKVLAAYACTSSVEELRAMFKNISELLSCSNPRRRAN